MLKLPVVLFLVAGVWGLTEGPDATRDAEVRVLVEGLHPGVSLQPSDVSAFIDGIEVPVVSVTKDSSPLALGIVVDLTASARSGLNLDRVQMGRDPESWRKGLKEALVVSIHAGDRVAVGFFGREVSWLLPGVFTGNPAEVDSAMAAPFVADPASFFGPSPIWDIVARAVLTLRVQAGCQQLLLISDGEASGNNLSMADAARTAIQAGVGISSIFLPYQETEAKVSDSLSQDRLLRELTRRTGGVFATSSTLASDGWRRRPMPYAAVLSAIQARYQVRVDVPEGKRPIVVVTARRDGLVLHAPQSAASTF